MDPTPPPEGISADDWAATPSFIQHAFVALLTIVAQQQQQLADLQAQVAELSARLNQHSQNASKPPSSDPPSAPPRPTRVSRGRAKGGQPRHERHERPEPEPDQIDVVQHHRPLTCPACLEPLLPTLQEACAVRTQYVWELPLVRPHITAHQYHTVNAAERTLRPAVLWRKGCFGAQSAEGNTFVGRILTVSATCRQQNRHLRTFLTEAVSAYWAGRPAPSLVPTP